jgi:hypothetical protein
MSQQLASPLATSVQRTLENEAMSRNFRIVAAHRAGYLAGLPSPWFPGRYDDNISRRISPAISPTAARLTR